MTFFLTIGHEPLRMFEKLVDYVQDLSSWKTPPSYWHHPMRPKIITAITMCVPIPLHPNIYTNQISHLNQWLKPFYLFQHHDNNNNNKTTTTDYNNNFFAIRNQDTSSNFTMRHAIRDFHKYSLSFTLLTLSVTTSRKKLHNNLTIHLLSYHLL